MKITDLKVGDIVKTRDGYGHVVFSNNLSPNGLGLFNAKSIGCSAYLSHYNDDLKHENDKRKDIMAVYKASEPNRYTYSVTCRILNEPEFNIEYYMAHYNDIKWDWERVEKKKMTVEEIEKILGYGIEIVSDRKEN